MRPSSILALIATAIPGLLAACALALVAGAAAAEAVDAAAGLPRAGDCAVYREGGEGYVLRLPTYWVRGTLVEVYRQTHRLARCPALDRPQRQFTREDWQRVTEAYPCVDHDVEARDIERIRVRLRVDAWETPWTNAHGHNGRLYRGRYLDTDLRAGVVLDLDAGLLQRCEAAP